MPPFAKPRFDYTYDVALEIAALREYRDTKPGRRIPARSKSRLLLATWNVANCGLQDRRPDDYALIAEIISWFDMVALQEVNENLSGLRGIQKALPAYYRVLFSDDSGNNERLTYLYDSRKVTLLEQVGEVSVTPAELQLIRFEDITRKFEGFDRSPYLAAFQAGKFRFLLVNVHLYFGSESNADSMARRTLETYAVARWAELNSRSKHAYTRDVIALGDFNLPKAAPEDPIFRALTRRGLQLPKHSTEIGSSIASDSHYDQVAFFPTETNEEFTGAAGVFDFDGAVFRSLWNSRTNVQFNAYVRYYLSDHRPLWVEFEI